MARANILNQVKTAKTNLKQRLNASDVKHKQSFKKDTPVAAKNTIARKTLK